jgi:hypothetical protein
MDAHGCEAENPAALRDSLKPVRSQRPDYTFAANAVTAVGCLTLLHCASAATRFAGPNGRTGPGEGVSRWIEHPDVSRSDGDNPGRASSYANG